MKEGDGSQRKGLSWSLDHWSVLAQNTNDEQLRILFDYYMPPMVVLLPPEQDHKFHLLLCSIQGLVQISFWQTALNNKLSFTVMVLKTCQAVVCMHLITVCIYWTRQLQATSTWKCQFLGFLLQRSANICLLLSVYVCACNNSRTSQQILIKFIMENFTKIFHHLKFSWNLENSSRLFTWRYRSLSVCISNTNH